MILEETVFVLEKNDGFYCISPYYSRLLNSRKKNRPVSAVCVLLLKV